MRVLSIFLLTSLLLLACMGASHPTGSFTCVYNGEVNSADPGLLEALSVIIECPYQTLDFIDESTVLIGALGQEMPATYVVEGDLIKIYADGGMVVLRREADGSLQGVAPVKARFAPQ